MGKYHITLNITPGQTDALEEWRVKCGFTDQREMIEHVMFIGELLWEIYGGRSEQLSEANINDGLFDLGVAFISGGLRIDNAPDFSYEEEVTQDTWQEYLGFKSKSQFERHLQRLGLLVYACARRRPLDGDNFSELLHELSGRLMRAQLGADVQQSVKEYRVWQKERTRRPTLHPRKEMITR